MNNKPKFTVYISKYALSSGIKAQEVEDCGDGMVRTVGQWANYHHAGDWHTTMEAAIAKAELMRVKKVKSLEKQLAKMKSMKFERPKC